MLQEVVKGLHPFPPDSKMVIFGGGFSGQHIAKLGRMLGAKVLCSRREREKIGADFVFNSDTKEIPESKILEGTTHLLSCIPPSSQGTDPVLTH